MMSETKSQETAVLDGEQTAVLGGGCFWCLESIFTQLRGVISVESGYAGGHVENPTYKQVCSDTTGHAEVVRITFDPQVISFRDLMDVFFATHNPTTPGRQGDDIGSQYRSVIFYQNDAQKADAEAAMAQVTRRKLWRGPIVTELVPAAPFYPAEEVHHNYFARNPNQPYCQVVIAPKVAKFRKEFMAKLSR